MTTSNSVPACPPIGINVNNLGEGKQTDWADTTVGKRTKQASMADSRFNSGTFMALAIEGVGFENVTSTFEQSRSVIKEELFRVHQRPRQILSIFFQSLCLAD